MKKSTINYLAIIFFTFCILIGCKKEINLVPENATYDQVFWENGANVQKATAGAYSLLRDAFKLDRSYFVFGDLAADNFELGGSYWNYATFVKDRNFNFNYTPYLEASVQDWSRFYKIINQCHLIIENIDNIPDSKFSGGRAEKNTLKGEAKFLRAYTYFYMSRVWGDVILTTESFKDPLNIPPLPRSAESKTLEFCLKDLASATSLLDDSKPKTRAGKGSVLALTANIYAWQHNYTKAEQYCDSLIKSNKFQLENVADYKAIWKGGSKESIFELNMLYDAVSQNESSANFFNIFLAAPFIKDRNVADVWSANDISYDLFDNTDARYNQIFDGASNGSTVLLTKYTNINYFDSNDKTRYVVSNNLVLERLADIYLLRAEARYKNNNQSGALMDLNIIRSRAELVDYTGSGVNLFNEILDERRRELVGEGYNAYDIIRMEKLQYLFPDAYSNQRIAQKGYFWPLNMRTLAKQNPLLTQNEWWKGNF